MPTDSAFAAAKSQGGIPDGAAQQFSAYSVGPSEDYPVIDSLGWSPSLRLGPTNIPDSFRNSSGQPLQYPAFPNRDLIQRHSVEDQNAVGWTEAKSIKASENSYVRQAPPPRATPPPEDRPTMKLGQNTYSFTRPFDQNIARRFNGTHFSMADHHRNYGLSDPLAMAAQRRPGSGTRNTHRLTPQPWDTEVTDYSPVGAAPDPIATGYQTAYEVSYGSRSGRLM